MLATYTIYVRVCVCFVDGVVGCKMLICNKFIPIIELSTCFFQYLSIGETINFLIAHFNFYVL